MPRLERPFGEACLPYLYLPPQFDRGESPALNRVASIYGWPFLKAMLLFKRRHHVRTIEPIPSDPAKVPRSGLKPPAATVPEPRSEIQNYIWRQERAWAARISPFLFGNVLKVGNGLGYLTRFFQQDGINVVTLDISESSAALNRGAAILYDGEAFPFRDTVFDCVVFAFVLHHTPNPVKLLQEAYRVGSRIVVLEETYDSTFSKLDLVTRDIYVNWLAHQDGPIFWKSYFQRGILEQYFFQTNRGLVHHYSEPKRSYRKELYVVEPYTLDNPSALTETGQLSEYRTLEKGF